MIVRARVDDGAVQDPYVGDDEIRLECRGVCCAGSGILWRRRGQQG